MDGFYHAFALFLALNLAGGFVRIMRGPSRQDRMLAAQLFGTTGVAVLLVLSFAGEAPALRDVSLAFALLAVVNSVVFVRTSRRAGPGAPRSRPSA